MLTFIFSLLSHEASHSLSHHRYQYAHSEHNSIYTWSCCCTSSAEATTHGFCDPESCFPGQLVIVRWAAINVDTCYVATTTTERKPVPTFGTQTFTAPSKSMNVLVLCVGEFSSVSKSVPVTIVQPKPVVNLTVTPTTITPGQSITVTWSSTSATGCYWGTGVPNGPYTPPIALSGTQVYPIVQPNFGPALPSVINFAITCV